MGTSQNTHPDGSKPFVLRKLQLIEAIQQVCYFPPVRPAYGKYGTTANVVLTAMLNTMRDILKRDGTLLLPGIGRIDLAYVGPKLKPKYKLRVSRRFRRLLRDDPPTDNT